MPTKKQLEERIAELEADVNFHKLGHDINTAAAETAQSLHQDGIDKNKQLSIEKELSIICGESFMEAYNHELHKRNDARNGTYDERHHQMAWKFLVLYFYIDGRKPIKFGDGRITKIRKHVGKWAHKEGLYRTVLGAKSLRNIMPDPARFDRK